jgi:general secretion pathway protein B
MSAEARTRDAGKIMSYILDALKKAEQERGLKQVPGPAAAEDGLVAPRPRWRGVAAAAAVLGAALLLFFWLQLSQFRQPIADSVTGSGHPPAQSQQKEPLQKMAQEQGKIIPETSALRPAPRATPAPRAKEAAKEIRQDGAAPPSSGNQISRQEQENSSPRVPPSKIQESVPVPVVSSTPPLPLKEAIAKMHLSILSYAEPVSERMVFINGKKYVEGDLVEGYYLLEAISLDGALLSYKGERALLRP